MNWKTFWCEFWHRRRDWRYRRTQSLGGTVVYHCRKCRTERSQPMKKGA